jgi:hypothetical protein
MEASIEDPPRPDVIAGGTQSREARTRTVPTLHGNPVQHLRASTIGRRSWLSCAQTR